MMRNTRWISTSVLFGIAIVAGLICFAIGRWREDLFVGLGAALLLAMPSYWSLSWALGRSDKIFYSIYAAGAFFRLAGLFVTAYFVWRSGRFFLAPVLVSMVLFLFVFLMVEAYFLKRQALAAHGISL